MQHSGWEWEELDPMRVIDCLNSELLSWCYLFCCFFCQALGPEFIRMSDEPQILLELPGSIVVNFSSPVSKWGEITGGEPAMNSNVSHSMFWQMDLLFQNGEKIIRQLAMTSWPPLRLHRHQPQSGLQLTYLNSFVDFQPFLCHFLYLLQENKS